MSSKDVIERATVWKAPRFKRVEDDTNFVEGAPESLALANQIHALVMPGHRRIPAEHITTPKCRFGTGHHCQGQALDSGQPDIRLHFGCTNIYYGTSSPNCIKATIAASRWHRVRLGVGAEMLDKQPPQSSKANNPIYTQTPKYADV